ncbi:MAG: primosomal protein N' (replication factor Y) [Patiriisocius sp.]
MILPLPLKKRYCYRVPKEYNELVTKGLRVIVPFGRKKLYTAIIDKVHNEAPSRYDAKYIQSILDESPIVLERQLKYWKWIEEYYMCNPGDVMVAALPAGFKLSSESRVIIRENFTDEESLTDKEFLVYEALEIQNVLSLDEIAQIVQLKTTYPLVKSMISKGAIVIEEKINDKYKPKIEKYLELNDNLKEEDLKDIFDRLEKKAPKQLQALMQFLKSSQYFSADYKPVAKNVLSKESGLSSSVFKALTDKNILVQFEKEIGRVNVSNQNIEKIKSLSDDQLSAFDSVCHGFESNDICLLHGVTSSGKTEIYVKLIIDILKEKKQVLYLVPEIALTTQLITRLRKYFGEKVGVYHSGYSQDERLEIWNDLLNEKYNTYDIIIGPRSTLFLPFTNLGLVIVDEEHDASYKQYQPAPRYNARDSALVLAKLHQAKVLLGTATPSVESMWNAEQGNYAYVELKKRYGNIQLPEILVADVKKEQKRKSMSAHFTSLLMDEMKVALDNNQQVILFQNRRGYNPMWQCQDCGHVPQCTQCDVSLTYHKHIDLLKCHYCGYSEKASKSCIACGSNKLTMMGFGTEKIENDLKELFPKNTIARLDYDTTRKKNAYSKIIGEFESGSVDILVGTQMVTKGLDFDRVALVGILNADTMLNRADFRAFERSFQMMTQVSGRAGRKKGVNRGKVIIQSYQPNHWIIQMVTANNFIDMYKQEVLERKNFSYPPFVRIITLTLKHKQSELLDLGAEDLARRLKEKFGERVLGPEYPYVARIKNIFHKQIQLKIEREASVTKAKNILQNEMNEFIFDKNFKNIRIVIDVDPQ